ncbi:hypothetical protein C8R47DRAFT_405219 [Mycena vitilis]|nr:hypothetical protein C8R47DRAFT_405219 [Mycena vitilis]
MRQNLDQDYESKKDSIDSDNDDYFITKARPTNNTMIEWVYEIDLDNEVFLVDANPLFALNNMPTSEGFLEWIGFDSYGHRSYGPSTPEQHIYNWKSQPPKVDDCVIDDYARQSNSERYLSISELLETIEKLVGSCEATRIALYELSISRVMTRWEIGHKIRVLETVSDRSEMSETYMSSSCGIVGPLKSQLALRQRTGCRYTLTREVERRTSFDGGGPANTYIPTRMLPMPNGEERSSQLTITLISTRLVSAP